MIKMKNSFDYFLIIFSTHAPRLNAWWEFRKLAYFCSYTFWYLLCQSWEWIKFFFLKDCLIQSISNMPDCKNNVQKHNFTMYSYINSVLLGLLQVKLVYDVVMDNFTRQNLQYYWLWPGNSASVIFTPP